MDDRKDMAMDDGYDLAKITCAALQTEVNKINREMGELRSDIALRETEVAALKARLLGLKDALEVVERVHTNLLFALGEKLGG